MKSLPKIKDKHVERKMLPEVSFYPSAILRQSWRASCKLSHRCLRLPSGKILWNKGFLWWTWKHCWHSRAIWRPGNKAETMSPGQHPWGLVLFSQALVSAAVAHLRQLRWKPKAKPIETLSCFHAFIFNFEWQFNHLVWINCIAFIFF